MKKASETWYANQSDHLYGNKGQSINNNTQKNFKVSNSSCPFPKASETCYVNQSDHLYGKKGERIKNGQEKFKYSNSSSCPFPKASEAWYVQTAEKNKACSKHTI